jgi:hypothetical protein
VLKFIFWVLLVLNGVLLAYGQGYLGTFQGNEREPARIKNQLNTDKLILVAPAEAQAAANAAAAAAAAPVAAAAPELPACTEVGNFGGGEARRFEARLAALELGEHQSRQAVPSQEVTSHIVYVPPQGSKEGAERKAAELRNLGVSSYFIISDNSPMKWAISLGVFKTEAGAQTLLTALNRQGVHSARVAGRGPQGTRVAYQFRGIDAATRAQIIDIATTFPSQQVRACR